MYIINTYIKSSTIKKYKYNLQIMFSTVKQILTSYNSYLKSIMSLSIHVLEMKSKTNLSEFILQEKMLTASKFNIVLPLNGAIGMKYCFW